MIINFLEKYSTKKNVFIGIGFIIFINTIAFPYFPMLFSDSNLITGKILDIQFGFTPETVQELLFSLTEKGRHIYYLSTIIIDIPYAFIYGLIVSLLIVFLLKKRKYKRLKTKKSQILILMPFLISFFDLIENGGIIYFINAFPYIDPEIIKLISISNQLKWTLAFTTSIIVLTLIYQSFGKRNNAYKVED